MGPAPRSHQRLAGLGLVGHDGRPGGPGGVRREVWQVSINGGSKNDGFSWKNQLNMDDLGVPLFQDTSICWFNLFSFQATGERWPLLVDLGHSDLELLFKHI